jgi:hypothetical protein
MPLDSDGRRYADNLFSRSFEAIIRDQIQETGRIRADFAQRNMLTSGGYFAALGRASVNQIRLFAQAKAESLLRAYERSGLPFDDAAMGEIKSEVTELCGTQKSHAVLAIGQAEKQAYGGQLPPPGMDAAIVGQIDSEVSAVVSGVIRELRIKRDEAILDEKRVRKAYAAGLGKEWDVFVCHASEDKEGFVRPLANALADSGLRVWYDESTLKVGDSLRTAIDGGLGRCRFGVIVLSTNFFAKQWPQRELDGLIANEVVGVKVILPVWHNISAEEVRRASPMLAGRVAAKSSDGLGVVVRQLREAMGL